MSLTRGTHFTPLGVYEYAIKKANPRSTAARVFWQDTIHSANRHGALSNEQGEYLLSLIGRALEDRFTAGRRRRRRRR